MIARQKMKITMCITTAMILTGIIEWNEPHSSLDAQIALRPACIGSVVLCDQDVAETDENPMARCVRCELGENEWTNGEGHFRGFANRQSSYDVVAMMGDDASQRQSPNSTTEKEPRSEKPVQKPSMPEFKKKATEALRWLPADTETIMMAQGPFRLKIENLEDREGKAKFEDMLRLTTLSLLVQMNDGEYVKELMKIEIDSSVEGSRRFRAPSGMGASSFEGCQIVMFSQGQAAAVETLMSRITADAAMTENIAGNVVAVFREEVEQDIWNLLITKPDANTIIVSTSREYLEVVLNRLADKNQPMALPTNIPEWQRIDKQASFWAVRHFAKTHFCDDPTSPFAAVDIGWDCIDPKAIGLAFSYRPTDAKLVRVYYFSQSSDAATIAKKAWSMPAPFNLPLQVRALRDSVVVEITHQLPRTKIPLLVILWGRFGHAMVF